MSDLESEESVKQRINQKREGLKILTPNQRLFQNSRLFRVHC